jgi:hypothetical protein
MSASATWTALSRLLHAFLTSMTGQASPSLAATTWAVAGSAMSCDADPNSSRSIPAGSVPVLASTFREAATARSEAISSSAAT